MEGSQTQWGSTVRLLWDSVEEAGGGDVEAVGDLRDDLDAGVAALRLDAGDVGHVQVGELREALLETLLLSTIAPRGVKQAASRHASVAL